MGPLARIRQLLGMAPRTGAKVPTHTDPEWARVTELFGRVSELDSEERDAALSDAGRDDPALRDEVESLLAAHAGVGPLDSLAGELAVQLDSPFPASRPEAGRIVSHYRLADRLGSGGMGVVYRARDTRLDREVALKFLPWFVGGDAVARDRLLAEARAAATLDHPNICAVHEVGETEEGWPFIAMPLYRGDTVADLISRGPLPIDRAIDIGLQACAGLEHAHTKGIVHRDIKPANLIVTADGTVKILDFGLAKRLEASLSRPDGWMGTPAYMSPEQLRGDPVDGRADVWALGVVLYEMLAGRRPFEADDDRALMNVILSRPAPPLASNRADLPAGLEETMGRALAASPEDRFPDVSGLAAALQQVGEPVPGASAGAGATVLPRGGERRQACILVASVKDFPELAEALPPEELEARIADLRRTVSDVIGAAGGMVNEFAGDAFVALFGIPSTHEDDDARAVRAALSLRDGIRDAGVELGLGLASGLVAARPATDGGYAYRIAGEPMRLARLLASHADPGEVMVSPGMRRGYRALFETRPAAPLGIGAGEAPIEPHLVMGESRFRSRLEADASAGLTEYAGRSAELRTLQAALARTLEGEGQVVTVVGEAGVGKSRLLLEFRRALDPGRVRVLQGRCQSLGSGIPYLPLLEILRDRLDFAPEHARDMAAGDEASATVARIREIAPELEDFVPVFLHLLALPSPENPLPRHMEGERLRVAMQEAIASMLSLGARDRPTLVLLEDWHWADSASTEALRRLVELVPAHALMVVVSRRSGHPVDWGEQPGHVALHLGPLDRDASAMMIRSLLDTSRVPAGLVRLLHERTGGNPFFLEETCRTLAEEGVLRVEDGEATLAGGAERLRLPDTVQGVIRTRLDRLEPAAREAVRVASVVGRQFTRSLLEAACPDQPLDAAFDGLKRLGIVEQVDLLPHAVYRFRHVLTQEVAYDTLLDHQRRSLHGRVARAIEQVGTDRLAPRLDRLAYHYGEAQAWDRAVHYGREAAEMAASMCDFAEAARLLEQALERVGHLPDDTARDELKAAILFRLERLCEALGRRERQLRICDQLITILEPLDEGRALAEAYLRRGDVHILMRKFDDAARALDQALRLCRRRDDAIGERNTLRSLGLLSWHCERNEEALEFMRRALEIDRRRGDREGLVGDLGNLGNLVMATGDLDEARRHLEEALALATELDAVSAAGPPAGTGSGDGRPEHIPWTAGSGERGGGPEGLALGPRGAHRLVKLSFVLHLLGKLHVLLGEEERGREYYDRAIEHSRRSRALEHLGYHLLAAARLHLRRGEIEESLSLYREAVDVHRSVRHLGGLSQSLRILGDVLLEIGRIGDALPMLEEAAGIFRRLRDHDAEAAVRERIAGAQERRDDLHASGDAWDEVLALYRNAGDPAGERRALEGLARALRSSDPDRSLACLGDALALAERQGDRRAQAELLNSLGIREWESGHYRNALESYERALGIFRERGELDAAGLALNSIGVTLRALGRHDQAMTRLEEAVGLNRRAGNRLLEGHALAALGDLHAHRKDWAAARESYEASLRIRRDIGDGRGTGWMLERLARVEREAGSPERAARYATDALEAATAAGDEALVTACRALRDSKD